MLFQSFHLSFLVSFAQFGLLGLRLKTGEFVLVTLRAAFPELCEHFGLELCEFLELLCRVPLGSQDFGGQSFDVSQRNQNAVQVLQSLVAFFP